MTRSSKRLWAFAAASAAVTPSSAPSSSLVAAGFATEPRRSSRVSKSESASSGAAASSVVPSNKTMSAITTTTTTPSSKKRKPASACVSPSVSSLSSSSTSKKSKKKPSSSATTSKKKSAVRTQSFGARVHPKVKPHTLILGTHPSIQSLAMHQYYGHPMNAFWWIAGDCLGFRRGTAVSPVTDIPYRFASDLKHGNDSILSYPQQLAKLLESGFCLWDVVGACERPGSLDQDIRKAEPNDIYALCQAHPSIRRIVLANGGSGSKEFIRHFTDWLASGQLVVEDSAEDDNGDCYSKKAFGPALKRLSNTKKKKKNSHETELSWTSPHTIQLVSAISVSPAAAKFSYVEKRKFWERHVYQPGLDVLRQQQ